MQTAPIPTEAEEQQYISEMDAHAHEHIQQAQDDPTKQQYFYDKTNKVLLKSQHAFELAQKLGYEIKVINYSQALEAINQEKAKANKLIKRRAKTKLARKQNRVRLRRERSR